ncbi:HAD-IA family hydrolase [Carboxydochorda subterranea]|uniref:HAD-IA family hydrolase n=1 Tax=Carboxydichorda subterranea TaxID=3109565 RepID=A0ABZ1BVA1_9FIRM|nr:HAD-IA family hydrolase [Limnochorda sp. L945t]WRP16619.1 HAD-IA family hydrolase [Limnochorda sp. L945t]
MEATEQAPRSERDARLDALCQRVAPHLRVVLLDAGNTLIYPDWERVAAWCRHEGVQVTARQLVQAEYVAKAAVDALVQRRRPSMPEGYFGVAMEAAGVPPEVRQRVLPRIAEAEHAGVMWLVVREGTAEALQQLRGAGLRLGVVSNADGRVEAFLEQAELRRWLDFVVDSHRVGVEKPDPAIFRIALERAGVAPDEAIHVGDICAIDVAGARSAGIEAVLMDPMGLYARCDVARIHDLGELAAAIVAHRGPRQAG